MHEIKSFYVLCCILYMAMEFNFLVIGFVSVGAGTAELSNSDASITTLLHVVQFPILASANFLHETITLIRVSPAKCDVIFLQYLVFSI